MNFSNTDLECLVARVEKLESQNRRWKLAAAVITLSSASLILAGAALADHVGPQVFRAHTVEAQDFALKTEGGRVYARLALNLDRTETTGSFSVITRGPSGPALEFYDNDGQPTWTAPQQPMMRPTIR